MTSIRGRSRDERPHGSAAARRPRTLRWPLRATGIALLAATLGCQGLTLSLAPAPEAPTSPVPGADGTLPTALAGSGPGATVEPTATEGTLPVATTAAPAINPLTGLPVADASLIQRRPIGIKVSNYPRTARPQAGLSFADLLFEFYQEAGDTRFHAIFLGNDVEKVGPIRSGRKVDSNLQQLYQSLLIFNAADYRVWEYFHETPSQEFIIPEGPAPCPALCRDSSQSQINSLYANTAALRKAADALKIPNIAPDLSGMTFDAAPPSGGAPASDVLVRFYTDNARAEWRYDPATQKYYRWSETSSGGLAPLKDRLTGQQLAVSNLAVVFVTFYRPQQVEIYDVMLYGTGRAVLFRDGVATEGGWLVASPDHPLQFITSSGPFAFHPGVTWIALIGEHSTFTQSEGTWRFEFAFP
jgi:hypothetical protein